MDGGTRGKSRGGDVAIPRNQHPAEYEADYQKGVNLELAYLTNGDPMAIDRVMSMNVDEYYSYLQAVYDMKRVQLPKKEGEPKPKNGYIGARR